MVHDNQQSPADYFLFVCFFVFISARKKWATNVYDPSVCVCVCVRECMRDCFMSLFYVRQYSKQHLGTLLLPHADWLIRSALNWLEAGLINLLAHEWWLASNIDRRLQFSMQTTCRPTPANFSQLMLKAMDCWRHIGNVDTVRIFTKHSVHTLGNIQLWNGSCKHTLCSFST